MVEYTEIILTSMFTGVGTAIGLAVFEIFLKEKIHNIGTKIKTTPKNILGIKEEQ